jgi:signal transduction histidine kinase
MIGNNDPARKARKKWRPSIRLVLSAVLLTVLVLPLVVLFFLRIYENELIRQTEGELIAESAVMASAAKQAMIARGIDKFVLGPHVIPQAITADEAFHPILPALDLTYDTVWPSRPEAQPKQPPSLEYLALGQYMLPLLLDTQQVTLGGFRILDPEGVVIAGKEDVGLSFAHVEEVASALKGTFRSVMRQRVSKHDPPPLYSLSRGTGFRIFVAIPIVVNDQIAGAVYASRTPLNIYTQFYSERKKLSLAALFLVLFTVTIGFVFYRVITRPIHNLMNQTRAIAAGSVYGQSRIQHYGTSEFAALSDSFLEMAEKLQTRSRYVSTFTSHLSHELKSPLTSIQGAAELLKDDIASDAAMSKDEKIHFLNNIIADTKTLNHMVKRLRELAQSEMSTSRGTSKLAEIVSDLRQVYPALDVSLQGDMDEIIGISAENMKIVLSHLADNALQHGAAVLTLTASRNGAFLKIRVRDNGTGIAPGNSERVFDPFFTTRRQGGGTGMGLPIVRALLQAHDSTIELCNTEGGAEFVLCIRSERPNA